jgi:4-diphosphocytidyl-2-C-methyl-D-erythritol kinase
LLRRAAPRNDKGVAAVTEFAPAKLNLFLAITGRRADGFHDLVSVVAPLAFGDTLHAEPANEYSLSCDTADVPCDETNLILKAARAFSAKRGNAAVRGARFALEKRIPLGAGLGGGSSDGVAALRALHRLNSGTEQRVADDLLELASTLGSDCPLFLQGAPVVMRGRGERVAPLSAAAQARIRGRRVLVFKPAFGIATPWAYAQLVASAPTGYLSSAEAEARVNAWVSDAAAPLEALLFNNMEPPAFAKFVALPVLLEELRGFGLQPRMSGSGSACFALLAEDFDPALVISRIRAAWGESAFVVETRFA